MRHVYEVQPRSDKRGVDLISDALPSVACGTANRTQSATRSFTAAPRVAELFRHETRRASHANVAMTFGGILATAAYLVDLFHFWNVWLTVTALNPDNTAAVARLPECEIAATQSLGSGFFIFCQTVYRRLLLQRSQSSKTRLTLSSR